MRVAVADVGTNSTRLLVADIVDGALHEVERRLAITRLGQDVDASGVLAECARERVLRCLEGYAERGRALGAERMLAVATSAVRDAGDGEAFLQEVEATGFAARLLSGAEEAEATFRGVVSARADAGAGVLVVDVGGGSTELVLGGPDGGVGWSCSLDVGCVRVTERFLGEGPVSACDLDVLVGHLRRLLAAVPDEVEDSVRVGVAVAGTATTAAVLDLGLPDEDVERVHGHVLARRRLLALQQRLAAMTVAERTAIPGMPAGRASVIVGGLVVLGAVLDRLGLADVEVSERDLLHGAALLAAGSPQPIGG
jgi:exopolyphosphatase / guanosine-5'-triphosphate,3'-diphosphate pyrophosphatase